MDVFVFSHLLLIPLKLAHLKEKGRPGLVQSSPLAFNHLFCIASRNELLSGLFGVESHTSPPSSLSVWMCQWHAHTLECCLCAGL